MCLLGKAFSDLAGFPNARGRYAIVFRVRDLNGEIWLKQPNPLHSALPQAAA